MTTTNTPKPVEALSLWHWESHYKQEFHLKPRPLLHMTDSRDMASSTSYHSRSLLTLETCSLLPLHELHDPPELQPRPSQDAGPRILLDETLSSLAIFKRLTNTQPNISHFIIKIFYKFPLPTRHFLTINALKPPEMPSNKLKSTQITYLSSRFSINYWRNLLF